MKTTDVELVSEQSVSSVATLLNIFSFAVLAYLFIRAQQLGHDFALVVPPQGHLAGLPADADVQLAVGGEEQ